MRTEKQIRRLEIKDALVLTMTAMEVAESHGMYLDRRGYVEHVGETRHFWSLINKVTAVGGQWKEGVCQPIIEDYITRLMLKAELVGLELGKHLEVKLMDEIQRGWDRCNLASLFILESEIDRVLEGDEEGRLSMWTRMHCRVERARTNMGESVYDGSDFKDVSFKGYAAIPGSFKKDRDLMPSEKALKEKVVIAAEEGSTYTNVWAKPDGGVSIRLDGRSMSVVVMLEDEDTEELNTELFQFKPGAVFKNPAINVPATVTPWSWRKGRDQYLTTEDAINKWMGESGPKKVSLVKHRVLKDYITVNVYKRDLEQLLLEHSPTSKWMVTQVDAALEAGSAWPVTIKVSPEDAHTYMGKPVSQGKISTTEYGLVTASGLCVGVVYNMQFERTGEFWVNAVVQSEGNKVWVESTILKGKPAVMPAAGLVKGNELVLVWENGWVYKTQDEVLRSWLEVSLPEVHNQKDARHAMAIVAKAHNALVLV